MGTKAKQKKSSPKQKRYSVVLKLRAVKLYTEERYPREAVAGELGVGLSTLTTWAKRYREEGVAGLKDRPPIAKGRRQVEPAVKAKAVELKRQDPQRGSKRISHLLRRMFLLQASPETVRRTLKEEGLVEAPKRKPQRNPARPRFTAPLTANDNSQFLSHVEYSRRFLMGS